MTDVRGTAVAAQPGSKPGIRGTSRVRTAVVWEVLRGVLAEAAAARGRPELDVVDVGGGTGGFAVPLAELGHRVTVVDASPDSLAALERRAAEAGVPVRGVQGDAGDLPDLLGPDSADLVLCHSVLEYVDDPAAAMTAVAGSVRPGGAVSALVAGRLAAVLHRAVAGHFDEARQALADPAGRWGDRDPVPHRFTRESLAHLAEAAGLRVGELHGVRIFADLVPGALVDDVVPARAPYAHPDPAVPPVSSVPRGGDSVHGAGPGHAAEVSAADALIALESAAAAHPVLRDLATQLHLLAYRP